MLQACVPYPLLILLVFFGGGRDTRLLINYWSPPHFFFPLKRKKKSWFLTSSIRKKSGLHNCIRRIQLMLKRLKKQTSLSHGNQPNVPIKSKPSDIQFHVGTFGPYHDIKTCPSPHPCTHTHTPESVLADHHPNEMRSYWKCKFSWVRCDNGKRWHYKQSGGKKRSSNVQEQNGTRKRNVQEKQNRKRHGDGKR